jgi:hypothetical protein
VQKYADKVGLKNKIVSYLPLSHIAGQINDFMCKKIFFILNSNYYY